MDRKISSELQRAREYEAEWEKKVPQETRPAFHVTPAIGWMNDPNGFSFYQGEYHLFYQYHPYDIHRGPMHWGHYKSKDLIRWERMPCAIAPDTAYDGEGCFSGSAMEYEGKHMLLYTSVMEQDLGNGKSRLIQNQSLAVGDGAHYEKCAENPVITGDMLPAGYAWEDFRDPKLWREGDRFFVVAGCQDRSNGSDGQLALFSSENGVGWRFEKILDRSNGEWGGMWECPDFFPLDGRQVLILSPQFMKAKGLEFHEGSNSLYFVGTYDRERMEFHREKAYQIDYGMDFYSPQTMETADGRRILMGWMQDVENYLVPEGMLWSGILTIPRELVRKGDRILQWPVRELEAYRQDKVYFSEVALQSADGERMLEGIGGRSFDMTVEITEGEYDSFALWLAGDAERKTGLCYQKEAGIFTVDRSGSGVEKDAVCRRSMRVDAEQGKIKLRVLMDKFSLEVFVNDGAAVMSALVYTPLEAEEIRFSCEGEMKISVEYYRMPV